RGGRAATLKNDSGTQCARKVRRVLSLFARIGRLDDRADRVLIEPFEAAFALQVLQMAADGAFAYKLAELFLINESLAQQPLGPLPVGGGPAIVLRSVKACLRNGKSTKWMREQRKV